VQSGVDSFGSIESGDYDKFNSECKQTMVGFVQETGAKTSSMAQHKVTCFHAVQEKHYDIEKTKQINNGKMKIAKIIEHKQITPVDLFQTPPVSHVQTKTNNGVTKTRANKRRNLHLEHRPSDEMDLLITEINNSDLGWKADTCKY